MATEVETPRDILLVEPVPGTRFMLMAARPYGESPIFNGPHVD